MAVDYLTIASGQAASPAYFIQRADLPVTLVIPTSINASEIRFHCATTSGQSGTGDAWGDVQVQQSPGNNYGPFTVWSGGSNPRPVFVGPLMLPTPFVRIFMVSSTTFPQTYTIMTARFGTG